MALLPCRPGLARSVLVTALVACLASCAVDGPYARDNPFDPDADVVIRIVGPDSIHASFERITFTIESDSPLPPAPLGVSWESSSALLLALGGGAYRTGNLPAQYQPVQVLVYFLDRVVSKTIYVGQLP